MSYLSTHSYDFSKNCPKSKGNCSNYKFSSVDPGKILVYTPHGLQGLKMSFKGRAIFCKFVQNRICIYIYYFFTVLTLYLQFKGLKIHRLSYWSSYEGGLDIVIHPRQSVHLPIPVFLKKLRLVIFPIFRSACIRYVRLTLPLVLFDKKTSIYPTQKR